MRTAALNQLFKLGAKLVVWIARNMMKLIIGNQSVVKGFNTQLFKRKAKGCVRADQHLLAAPPNSFPAVHR